MKQCTTHHYACDCREAKHADKIAELETHVVVDKKDLILYLDVTSKFLENLYNGDICVDQLLQTIEIMANVLLSAKAKEKAAK